MRALGKVPALQVVSDPSAFQAGLLEALLPAWRVVALSPGPRFSGRFGAEPEADPVDAARLPVLPVQASQAPASPAGVFRMHLRAEPVFELIRAALPARVRARAGRRAALALAAFPRTAPAPEQAAIPFLLSASCRALSVPQASAPAFAVGAGSAVTPICRASAGRAAVSPCLSG